MFAFGHVLVPRVVVSQKKKRANINNNMNAVKSKVWIIWPRDGIHNVDLVEEEEAEEGKREGEWEGEREAGEEEEEEGGEEEEDKQENKKTSYEKATVRRFDHVMVPRGLLLYNKNMKPTRRKRRKCGMVWPRKGIQSAALVR